MAAGPRIGNPAPSRFVLPILGLVALGLCVGGLLVLIDHHGAQNLLASIYDALGNSAGANDLRNGSGDVVIARILLAVIALGVGVGGIWLLFLGLGGLVEPAPAGLAGPAPALDLRRPGARLPGDVPALSRAGARSRAASSMTREGSRSTTTP